MREYCIPAHLGTVQGAVTEVIEEDAAQAIRCPEASLCNILSVCRSPVGVFFDAIHDSDGRIGAS